MYCLVKPLPEIEYQPICPLEIVSVHKKGTKNVADVGFSVLLKKKKKTVWRFNDLWKDPILFKWTMYASILVKITAIDR